MKEKFYITTPIYYPSGKWHLGTCYTTVVCDALARFKRMQGYDVFYLTGTDEHGQKIEKVAQSHGMPTKKFVDKQVESLKKIWKLLNISYDKFIRTTDEYHQKAVQKIFQKLYDKGDIYKSEYEGWYCTPCEAFWTEKQLKENKCPDCGREVELTKESSYFFRLSKYQDRLIELIENNPEFLQPKSRQNEMLNNFLRAGLQDLAVSRTSFKWGVPVPFDKDHVIYVWIDALSNYITALGYMGEDDSLFKKFWPADIHMMGKEIIRFHSIIWPAILMALDVELPKKVYGHGWLLFGSDKISKSKGNIIDPIILSERYKVDAVRYYLLREIPFGQDGAFSNYAFLSRINADLCNSLGNLLSRTTAMVNQYFDGILPKSKKKGEHDSELIEIADNVFEKVKDNVDKLLIPEALTEIWNLINRSNKYIDETQPWILGKDEAQKDRLSTILYNLVECLRISATLLKPFLPDTAQRILSDLSLQDVNEFSENTKFGYLKGGEKITKSQPLFPRININKELEEMDKLASMLEKKNELGKGTNEIKKPEIEFDDFSKLDLKVGTVKACERIPKSAKLLKLTVEIGDEERTIVSGIAKSFEPDDLVGKQVVVVTNLKPVKLCGVESQGMVLCTEDENGIVLISPQRDVPSGERGQLMLIDSHAHLNDKRLIDEVEDIVRDMPKDNLEAIINVGYDYESSKVSVELANRFSNVYAAVGIHPHDAKYAAKSHYEFFEKAVKDEKVLAIGEIGLDFYYDHSPRDIQEKVFLEQLDLAHSLKKPAIIHLRDAYRPMYNLLKENIHKLEYGAILHCYSGSAEMLKEFAKLGLYFSFGGAITFKNAKNKPEVIRQTPIDKLLLETDCPYMTPEPYRGKTNYPKYISLVARRVAEILGKDYDDIVRTTNENTKRFFGPKLRK